MSSRNTSSSESTAEDREQLRRDLLKLIVKNEAGRRDQTKAPGK
jgi:hypothetical protein